jgi:hypothetical protein
LRLLTVRMATRIRSSSRRFQAEVLNDPRRDLDRFGRHRLHWNPRSAVIIQDHRFDATASRTVWAFTTDPTEAPLFRLPVEPAEKNGLRGCRKPSQDPSRHKL